jgi:hypothetical protein
LLGRYSYSIERKPDIQYICEAGVNRISKTAWATPEKAKWQFKRLYSKSNSELRRYKNMVSEYFSVRFYVIW